jgi:hypothetical protein
MKEFTERAEQSRAESREKSVREREVKGCVVLRRRDLSIL